MKDINYSTWQFFYQYVDQPVRDSSADRMTSDDTSRIVVYNARCQFSAVSGTPFVSHCQ